MKNKKLNILICGATGFIGKNMLDHFSKKKNARVFATYHHKNKFKKNNVNWIKIDLCNKVQVDKTLKNIDIVIQAAATTSGSKDIVNKPQIHVTDNAIMNSYIMSSAFDRGVKHVIFFSCTVMYPGSNFPLKEDSVKLNNKLEKKYFGVGHTKLYIEKICEFFGNLGKTKYTCIRHSNIYGPNDKFDLEKGHFFASNLLKIFHAKNNEISVWGKGTEKRDLLYITDLTNFVDKVIKFQKTKFNIYNCTYGKSFRVIDIIKKMIKYHERDIKINFDLTKPSISVNILVDSSKAKRELRWRPKVSIENGIQKTIKWLKINT